MINKLKHVGWILCLTIATGCAGAALQKEWENERGYSKADIDLVVPHYRAYNRALASAQYASNAFNSAPLHNAENKMKAIYCGCRKQLGDKCQQKPDALDEKQKTLWAKANAAEMALRTVASASASEIDPAECDVLAGL